MLVAHVERAGVWLLEGGMNAMVDALSNVARQNGAEIICKSAVEEIRFRGRQVSGIQTQNGDWETADGVLCCVDIGAVAAGHYGADAAKAIGSQRNAIRSQSAITWTMEAISSGAELDAHNVFFSDNYKSEFDAVFGAKTVPTTPTVYLHAPQARTGKTHPVFCLINAPADGDVRTYSDKETDQWLTRTMSQIKACGITLTPTARTVSAQSPSTYAARFPGTGGALYGPASHGWQAAFKRHGVRTRRKGFYLAGGSIHPGPGVPMAALSGRSAALAMMEDFSLTGRSQLAVMRGGISMQ
jgi:1-hydroxycarotenoid 3,4-desaturase